MYKTTKGAPHVLMDLLPPEDEQTKRKCDADVHSLGNYALDPYVNTLCFTSFHDHSQLYSIHSILSCVL